MNYKIAVLTGYWTPGIMIDGSKLDYEANIALAQKVVAEAKNYGVPVEAELGKVGGKEDDLVVKDVDTNTDPKQAQDYAERTGIDSLAVAIGTAHAVRGLSERELFPVQTLQFHRFQTVWFICGIRSRSGEKCSSVFR